MNPNYEIIHTTQCCGMRELYRISDKEPQAVAYTVCKANTARVGGKNGLYYLFTDNTLGSDDRAHYGELMANFIRDNNLGTVTELEQGYNINSGNILKLYVWKVAEMHRMDEFVTACEVNNLRPLHEAGFEIGSFVRCNNPDVQEYFEGRGQIVHSDNTSITIRLQGGRNWFYPIIDVGSLVKTRPFRV